MATTSYESIRASQITAIRAITPTCLADVSYLPHLEETEFRDWAQENATAALRRFSVLDLFDYDDIETSNTDVEWTIGRNEVVVAYPRDYRYGAENRRDLNDVIREDERQLEGAIGARGYSNYTDAAAIREGFTVEETDSVVFLVLTYRFHFWRDVS